MGLSVFFTPMNDVSLPLIHLDRLVRFQNYAFPTRHIMLTAKSRYQGLPERNTDKCSLGLIETQIHCIKGAAPLTPIYTCLIVIRISQSPNNM